MAVRGTITHRWWLPLAISLAIAVAGLGGVKHYVVDLLLAAARMACPRVHPSEAGIVISSVILLFGVLGVVVTLLPATGSRPRGARPWDRLLLDPRTQRLTQRGWLISATIIGASFLVYAWVQAQLWASGYV